MIKRMIEWKEVGVHNVEIKTYSQGCRGREDAVTDDWF